MKQLPVSNAHTVYAVLQLYALSESRLRLQQVTKQTSHSTTKYVKQQTCYEVDITDYKQKAA